MRDWVCMPVLCIYYLKNVTSTLMNTHARNVSETISHTSFRQYVSHIHSFFGCDAPLRALLTHTHLLSNLLKAGRLSTGEAVQSLLDQFYTCQSLPPTGKESTLNT